MRVYLFIVLYLSFGELFSQIVSDSSFYLKFDVKAHFEEDEGYVVSTDNLYNMFKLNGDLEHEYKIEIINDTTSVLSRGNEKTWVVLDTIGLMGLQVISTDTLFLNYPMFEVTDFDKDGYQDLLCYLGSNINGNTLTLIYLFNKEIHSLLILYNEAEGDKVGDWNNPEFNKQDSTINCEWVGGTFGTSLKSTYKLINQKAIPIKKTVKNRSSSRNINIYKYKGVDGKWKFVKKQKQ